MTVEQLERLVEAVETVVDIVHEADGEVLSVNIWGSAMQHKPLLHLDSDAFVGIFGGIDTVPHSPDYDKMSIDARGIEIIALKVKQ